MTLGFIIAILVWGFIIGGLARFAVPGPDPMPIWMTTAIGLGGALIARLVPKAPFRTGPGILLAFIFPVLLVIRYPRRVQDRPVTGRRAPEPRPPHNPGVAATAAT